MKASDIMRSIDLLREAAKKIGQIDSEEWDIVPRLLAEANSLEDELRVVGIEIKNG